MWRLTPGTCTLDVDEDDDTQDSVSPAGAESQAGDAAVPASSRVTVLDSDSEGEIFDDASIRNPLTPRLRPQDPAFGFTESLLLRPVEIMAMRMLQREHPPTREEVLELFLLIPISGLRRGNSTGESGIRYLVTGASPRSNVDVLSCCTDLPYFNLLVNRFIHHIAPAHRYSTFVIRQGCSGVVHRDVRNGPFRSMVVNLGLGGPGEGLWLHDRVGTVFKFFGEQQLPGVVVPLDKPFFLDARKCLHAGHVEDKRKAPARVVLIAFTTINLSGLGSYPRSRLLSLGFPLPHPNDPASQSEMNDFRGPPRLKQLSMQEALQALRSHSRQQVIEVVDSQ